VVASRRRRWTLRLVVAAVVLAPLVWLSLVPAVAGLFSTAPAGASPAGLPAAPSLLPPHGPVRTPWGVLTATPLVPTRATLALTLARGSARDTFLRLPSHVWKVLTGWQVAGAYLLVQVGFPPRARAGGPNAYPLRETVVDLSTRRILLNLPATAASRDYLTGDELVVRTRLTLAGRHVWRVTVVDLRRARRLDFVCPPGTMGAVVEGGRLFYEVAAGTLRRRLDVALTSQAWQPLGRWIPLYLPPS
jgi:hypothetical protein